LLVRGPVAQGVPSSRAPEELAQAVRPLLSSRCFACHGFDQKARQAGLRLDTLDGQRGAIGGRPTIVPFEPEASELWRRVTSHDPKTVMPPPDSGESLSDSELALLRTWIEAGAPFVDHWAFVAPRAVEPPPVRDRAWPRNPIDEFVLARLERAGWSPSAPADRRTLARRLSLDLLGLPPAPERVEAFVADVRPDAYERYVEELLASPHHGERLAQSWLDVARYADTNGFHHDNVRTAWPYRDWLIQAFAEDRPYDQFVTEQIAGDLLPVATDAQRIASGFCRMHNINDEGGALDEEYRVEAIADRIETVATAFLGLTFTCARCHDHKYDPFTQEDYYSLFSIFGSVDERGVYPNNGDEARAYPARIQYAPPALAERIEGHRRALAAQIEALTAAEPAVRSELTTFETALRERHRIVNANAELLDVRLASGAAVERLTDGSVRLAGRPKTERITLRYRVHGPALRMLRLDVLDDSSFPTGRVGLSANGNAVVSGLSVRVFDPASAAGSVEVAFEHAWADFEQPNGDFDVSNLIEGSGEGWALGGHLRGGPRSAFFVDVDGFGGDEDHGDFEVEVTIDCESGYTEHVVGRVRVDFLRALPSVREEFPLVARDWWSVGPFPAKDFDAAIATAFEPESERAIDPAATFGKLRWTHRPEVDGKVVPLNGERAAFYFARELRTATPRRLTLHLGSDDGVVVFLDGVEQFRNPTRRGAAPDQDRVDLDVPAGRHLLLVKVVNDGGPAGFYGRLEPSTADPLPLQPWLLVPPEQRPLAIAEPLLRSFGSRSPTYAALDARRAAIESELALAERDRVPVLVMSELKEPKQHHVLARGRYDMVDTARPVTRRPPLALGGEFPEGAPHDRLGFARWLTRRDHPLTARVEVNRIWQMLFGRGLVRSSENFGVQSEPPTHPQLLDWLAAWFVDHGWSRRELIRLIVTSSTYRQSARLDPALARDDPDHRLLGSFPRRRLAGEFVRDVALAASGLLVPKIGGPSVKPYQPDGLWREVSIGASSNTQVFQRDDGPALWRRSMYTFWKRTSPNPQMATFDLPTRESCQVQRAATNTPLQSLVLWNDEQFVEAARNLAQRVLRETSSDAGRIARMMELCTARTPSAREAGILAAALADFRARYAADPDSAKALLAVGESMVDAALDPVDSAAFCMLATTVLSLDATVVVD
jgi:hypothetical protein